MDVPSHILRDNQIGESSIELWGSVSMYDLCPLAEACGLRTHMFDQFVAYVWTPAREMRLMVLSKPLNAAHWRVTIVPIHVWSPVSPEMDRLVEALFEFAQRRFEAARAQDLKEVRDVIV